MTRDNLLTTILDLYTTCLKMLTYYNKDTELTSIINQYTIING